MPSPFPGMDPYIESPGLWGDFHNNLAMSIQMELTPSLRPHYFARLIPYVTYESLSIGQSIGKQIPTHETISVFQTPAKATLKDRSPASVATVATVLPLLSPMPVESQVRVEFPLHLASIEIYTVIDSTLVTVIEILSPVNKRVGHEAYDHYLRKRRQILNTNDVHLIEIDLLRGGERPALAKEVPKASYYVTLSRAERRPNVTVWPIQLNDRLPVIPVPLVYPDPDVPCDLGQLVANVYDRAAYDLQIDYQPDPPPPALSEEDANWLAALKESFLP